MGAAYGRTALAAGAGVVLLTVLQLVGLPGVELVPVATAGLLVAAGAAAVGFASGGTVRRLALTGAVLALVPVVVLASFLAV